MNRQTAAMDDDHNVSNVTLLLRRLARRGITPQAGDKIRHEQWCQDAEGSRPCSCQVTLVKSGRPKFQLGKTRMITAKHRPSYLTKNRYDEQDTKVRGLSAFQRAMRMEYMITKPTRRRIPSW